MPKLIFIFLFSFVVLVILRLLLFYLLPLNLHPGQEVDFQTTLIEDPKVTSGRQFFHAQIGDFWRRQEILIITKDIPLYEYGQTLNISGKIEKRLNGKQLIFAIYSPKIEARKSGILPFFAYLRQRIQNFCEQSLPQPYSGLLAGILLGFKSSLPPSSAAALRITGLSHVVVIDGLKITLVAGLLIDLFGLVFQRKLALALSILCILAYVALSGFEISALRAGAMGILAFSAQFWGRQYTGLYSLFLVGGFLLLWDPLLLQNVGFQLSVAATAGIILLKPLIPLKGILLDDISITFAAQISTLPILLGTFGNFSLLSVPVHALVMWTIPLIMILGGAGVIISFIFQPLGHLIVFLTFPLLWYFQEIINFFAKFGLQVQIPQISLFFAAGWYLLLFSSFLFFRVDKNKI